MLGENSEGERMTRAFLTDAERRAVRAESDMDRSNRSSHLSRIRGKMERMREDARHLREHRPELYEDLREAVVGEEMTARLDRLESEVETLRDQVDDS